MLDMDIGGRTRKVLVRPERNGFMYVIDRETGEVLSADAYGFSNSTTRIDLKSGRPVHNEENKPRVGEVVRAICPTAPGAKDWNPASYSPRTGLLYVAHLNLCVDFERVRSG